MKKLLILAAVTSLICGSLAAQKFIQRTDSVPVMLYPDTDHGTCSIGLKVNVGGAVLRSGPGENFPAIAALKAGHVVSGCDERNGWAGVIDGQDESCSVGITVSTILPYLGPCRSGWIEQSFLTGVYG